MVVVDRRARNAVEFGVWMLCAWLVALAVLVAFFRLVVVVGA